MEVNKEGSSSCTRAACCSWMIIFSAFSANFIIFGTLFNYSILFVSLQEQFDVSATLIDERTKVTLFKLFSYLVSVFVEWCVVINDRSELAVVGPIQAVLETITRKQGTRVISGLVGSIAYGLTFLVTPLTSQLLLKFSCRVIILAGILLYCTGLFATSFVTEFGYMYLTFGILVGVGANFTIYFSNYVVLMWFRNANIARASAFTVTGSSCGMLAVSPFLTNLINSYGWRIALRIISGGVLVSGLASGAFMKTPPPGDSSTDKKCLPEKTARGSEDENSPETTTWLTLNSLNAECVNDDNVNDREDNRSVSIEEKEETPNDLRPGVKGGLEMVKHLDPWAYFIATILALLGWTFFIINFASFMEQLGLTKDQVSFVIMFFAFGEIGGKILVSAVGHRFPVGLLYTPAASSIGGTVALGVMAACRTFPQMMTLSIFAGFSRAGLFGATQSVSAKLFHDYGTGATAAICLFPFGIGIVLSAPLSGGLYDVTGSYTLSLVIIAATFLCSAACFAFVPVRRRIRKGCSFLPSSSRCRCSSAVDETNRQPSTTDSSYNGLSRNGPNLNVKDI